MAAESNSALPSTGVAAEAPRSFGAQLVRRLFGNYVFHSMNWGIRVLEQLILIPLFMYAWGTTLYSDWLLVSSIVFFLGWCTFGVDDYFGNSLLQRASIGDHAGFERELKIALLVSCAISLSVAALVYGALLIVPITDVLSLSTMDARTGALIIIIMTPSWIRYPISILHTIYRAHGEFSRGERVSGVFMTLGLVSVATALAFRLSPLVIALLFSINSIVSGAFITIDVARRYPSVVLRFAVPERHRRWRLVQQSLFYFTNPLSTALTQNGALLMLGFFGAGASTIVAFNVFRVFTGLTRQLGISSFAVSTAVEMSRQYAQGDREGCRRLYASSSRIAACLAGVLAGLTLPISAPFVRLWTHGAVADDQALALCFLAGIFFAAPGRVSLTFLRFANEAYAFAFASCAYSIGGLALALALARPLGGLGVALALAIAEALVIGLYTPIAANKLFHFGGLRHVATGCIAGLCAFALSYVLARLLFASPDMGLVSLAARAAAWGILISLPCALCALSPSQRAKAMASAGTLWRRTWQASRGL